MIREMRAHDLTRVHEINQENLPAVGDESLESLRQLWTYCSLALVVELEGVVSGFCMLLPPHTEYQSPNYKFFHTRYEDFIYLDRVAFTARAQRLGWGARLYQTISERTRAPWLTLEVNVVPPNEGSLRFHAREGFTEIAREETRPGKVVSLMARALS